MFLYLADELGLLRGRLSTEAKALVVKHFRTAPIRVDLSSQENKGIDDIDNDSTVGDGSSAVGPSMGAKRGRGGRGSLAVPMTVLVLDEVDMAPPDLVRELLALSSSNPHSAGEDQQSSLIMLGIGNDILFSEKVEKNYEDSFTKKVVFSVYTADALKSIIDSRGMGLFDKFTKQMVVTKILHLKNGDVRALLDLSRECLKTAVETVAGNTTLLSAPASAFVKLKHAKTVFDRIGIAPNSEDTRIVDIVESLCPMNQIFILSLLLDQKHAIPSSASPTSDSAMASTQSLTRPWRKVNEMERIFSCYCDLKGINQEGGSGGSSYTTVRGFVETLETYNLMNRDKPVMHGGRAPARQGFSDKVSFRLDIEPKHVLTAKNISNSHKEELKKFLQGAGAMWTL